MKAGIFLSVFFTSLILAETSFSDVTAVPVIGRVIINRKTVFEGDDAWQHQFPYAWANKLHIVTKESFIRNELLFKEGDPVNALRISESERLLRSYPIFRYVHITPQPPVNGQVDVLIETEDVWTTTLQMAYGTAGGTNFYELGFLEKNFLGTGKSVGAFIDQGIDRLKRGVSYEDPQLLGSRWNLFGGYGYDEKGREWQVEIKQPYYSILVPHSEGGLFHTSDDEDRLFEDGEESANVRHHKNDVRTFYSYALRPSEEHVRRVQVAQDLVKDQFTDANGVFRAPLPAERTVSAMLVGFDFRNVKYSKQHGVMTFDRDEDLNLGWEWTAEAGPSLESIGATRDGGVGRFTVQRIFQPRPTDIWFNHLEADGRYENQQVQNGVLRLASQYFLPQWRGENTASMRAEYVVSKNLDPERQFLLGGENGMRGYSVRQFSGSNKMLFTLENRQTVLYDWLHLMSIGWAAFADTGAAWNQNLTPTLNGLKSDVGVGIRFAPSRSTDPGLIRIDAAYAFEDNHKQFPIILNIGADLHFGESHPKKFDQ